MCCNCFKCCKKIPKKRFALPFIGVFVLLILEEVRNFMYLPIVFSFGSFIIFWNFPFSGQYQPEKRKILLGPAGIKLSQTGFVGFFLFFCWWLLTPVTKGQKAGPHIHPASKMRNQ